jgi:hypothetical protein
MTTTKESSDERLLLSEALRVLQADKPWAPVAALRVAVAEGRIPSVRSSFKKRARYYVRMSDLLAALPDIDLPTLKA